MNIVVCIKQVPDTSEVKIDPVTNTLIREGVPSIVKPFYSYAIEEALRTKEKFGGKVVAISMGPPQAREALKEALAMGADEAYLLSDRAFAGSDTWATSYALAQAIRTIGDVDLIFCGRQAIDGDTGQVGPGIAYRLGVTQLTYVIKIRQLDPANKHIEVERLLEEGREVVSGTLPALITVVKGINEPRYPTFLGIRRATRAEIPIWDAGKVNADENKIGLKGSPTQVWKIFSPPRRGGQVQLMPGSTDEAAAALADKLLAEKVI